MTDTGLLGWARSKSPWLLHFNTGACNGCDIELIAVLTPTVDVERFGVILTPSPRHADILVVTGLVTEQVRPRLKRIYEQMPSPKCVVAIGSCALSGGIFKDGYDVVGGVDKVVPVDLYIPGCPPKPEAILHGISVLLGKSGGAKDGD